MINRAFKVVAEIRWLLKSPITDGPLPNYRFGVCRCAGRANLMQQQIQAKLTGELQRIETLSYSFA